MTQPPCKKLYIRLYNYFYMVKFLVKKADYCNGKGLFANKNFRKGETVLEFKGKIVGWTRATNRSLQIEDHKWIRPFQNSLESYINHSCNPTCGIKKLNMIVAMKLIKKGDEITFDYSTTVGENYWKMTCLCGSKNCRKIIGPYKFLTRKLKKKYKGWESDYLLKG